MHMFVNTRKIAASKDKAYELIVDSEMWPNFIKECKTKYGEMVARG